MLTTINTTSSSRIRELLVIIFLTTHMGCSKEAQLVCVSCNDPDGVKIFGHICVETDMDPNEHLRLFEEELRRSEDVGECFLVF